MPEEIILTDEEEEALDRVWAKRAERASASSQGVEPPAVPPEGLPAGNPPAPPPVPPAEPGADTRALADFIRRGFRR